MTVYMCSECNKPHDTSKDPMCPITLKFDVPTAAEVKQETSADPIYLQKYRCLHCDPHKLHKEMYLTDYHRHMAEHTTDALGECAADASQYRRSLMDLREFIRDSVGENNVKPPADLVLFFAANRVDAGLQDDEVTITQDKFLKEGQYTLVPGKTNEWVPPVTATIKECGSCGWFKYTGAEDVYCGHKTPAKYVVESAAPPSDCPFRRP